MDEFSALVERARETKTRAEDATIFSRFRARESFASDVVGVPQTRVSSGELTCVGTGRTRSKTDTD